MAGQKIRITLTSAVDRILAERYPATPHSSGNLTIEPTRPPVREFAIAS